MAIYVWVDGELKAPHTQGLKLSPKQKHQKDTLAELLSPAIRTMRTSAVALLLQGEDLARSRERLSWGHLVARATLIATSPLSPTTPAGT